ncbi:phosphotransferase [Cupriavidus necator]|uniref:phosphotransferase enzyme family protein n=1 Tax=Cupriavidus necator TaxID=106590 RepID=UPI0039C229DC
MPSDSEAPSSNDITLVRRAVLAAYGIDVNDVREVIRGVNRTFSISASGDRTYYLRLYRTHGRADDEIDAELSLLERVEQDEVLAVSIAHPTLDGTRSFRVALSDGVMRRAALFDGALGRPLRMTEDDLAVAAQALRRLHDQPSLKDCAPRRQIADIGEANRTLTRLAERFTYAGRGVAAARECCERLVAVGCSLSPMPFGFCHGDYRVENMRIAGSRITLFAFDDCGCGPQWFDLATMGWWLETDARYDAASLWRAFVRAYLPELHCCPDFHLAISLLILVNEIKSIRFLLDYCALDDDLWRDVCMRLDDLSLRAVSGQLAISRGSAC